MKPPYQQETRKSSQYKHGPQSGHVTPTQQPEANEHLEYILWAVYIQILNHPIKIPLIKCWQDGKLCTNVLGKTSLSQCCVSAISKHQIIKTGYKSNLETCTFKFELWRNRAAAKPPKPAPITITVGVEDAGATLTPPHVPANIMSKVKKSSTQIMKPKLQIR